MYIVKLYFQLCLPLILTNDCLIVRQFFPPDQAAFIKETCRKAARKHTMESEGSELPFHADMCLVVDLLLSVPQLMELCRGELSDAVSQASNGFTLNSRVLLPGFPDMLSYKCGSELEGSKYLKVRFLKTSDWDWLPFCVPATSNIGHIPLRRYHRTHGKYGLGAERDLISSAD